MKNAIEEQNPKIERKEVETNYGRLRATIIGALA